MQNQRLNIPLSQLETAQRIRHTAAYVKVNKRDPLWQQIAKLLEAEADTIIHDSINLLKDAHSSPQ